MSLLTTLRYHGRQVVLPVNEIRSTVQALLVENNIAKIVDFGAGTLYWSEWFADSLELDVTAVDLLFSKTQPDNKYQVAIRTDILEVLAEKEGVEKSEKEAIFICDVIHHLTPEFWSSILPRIAGVFDVIIIKDIDATRKIGNFCNKMHDLIINGEKIHDVHPKFICNYLQEQGFQVQIRACPKLWYPHFIITGIK